MAIRKWHSPLREDSLIGTSSPVRVSPSAAPPPTHPTCMGVSLNSSIMLHVRLMRLTGRLMSEVGA